MDERTASDSARLAWTLLRATVADPGTVALEHELMHAVDLSAGPIRVLRTLLADGPQAMSVLANTLGCDRSYVTSLVKPLLARSLVVIETDPQDGRMKVVSPTPAGLVVARRAQEVWDTPPAAVAGLADGELDSLARILTSAAERRVPQADAK